MRELMNNEMDGISGGLVGAPSGTGVVLLEANNATPWSNATSSGGCDSTGQCAIVYGAVGDTASGSLGPTDYTNYGIQSFQRFDDGTSLTIIGPVVPFPESFHLPPPANCGPSILRLEDGPCSLFVSTYVI